MPCPQVRRDRPVRKVPRGRKDPQAVMAQLDLQVRKAMSDEPYFNFWSALQRNSQEMMWKSTQLPVEP